MRACLIESKTSFLPYEKAVTQFYGYPYHLFNALKKLKTGASIEKCGIEPNPTLGKGLSIFASSLLKNFSGYDILHNLDLNPFFPVKKGKARIITTAHDFQFALAPELNADVAHGNIKSRIWINLIVKLGLRATLQSDSIIAASTLTRDDAVKLGYPKKQIYVVNHGISDQLLHSKRHYKKKGKRFIIGYLGALRTRKNPMFMIKAFNSIIGSEYALHIYGKLGYDQKNIINEAGSNKRIRFMGFAPENRLAQIYDSFDAFVFPSLYEGFGLPILEAQSRGLPVIIYKNGKIPVEVRKYCFEAGSPDHMARMVEDLNKNGYNDKLRKRSTKYARRFTWERCAKETLNIYKHAFN